MNRVVRLLSKNSPHIFRGNFAKRKKQKNNKKKPKKRKKQKILAETCPSGFWFFVFWLFCFFCSFFVFLGCPAQELFFHVFCFIFLVSFQINVEDVGRVLVVESFVLRRFPFEFWALGSLRSPCAGFA